MNTIRIAFIQTRAIHFFFQGKGKLTGSGHPPPKFANTLMAFEGLLHFL
jgi:hypothetical protein